VRRRLVAPFLICALLALPGCGMVKGVAKRSAVRFLSGTVAAMLFGSDEAAADDAEYVEDDDTTVADDEGGDGSFFGNGEDSSDDAAGSGFYKVVEANGTVRFVSSLEEVPAAQRPKAERIDSGPIGGGGDAKRRAPSRRAAQQLAAAKSAEPAAIRGGGHEVVVYTTSWCGWCKKTRAWLDDQGIDYENRDVETNAAWAEEMHDLTGSGGVPVIVIDGEVIQGFNQAQMEKMLRG
jgi:glutaredoxin-like YruB-family protein